MNIEIAKMLIDLELLRACKKHATWPRDLIHQTAIMTEEAGEALKAANDHRYNGVELEETIRRIKEEAVQTAAMALRILINLPKPGTPDDLGLPEKFKV